MARGNERTSRRSPKDAARRTKKKPCALCRDKIDWVDYKDVPMLRKYMSDRGKIRARRVTGNCAQHQREIALAIKTARELVLLPYTQRTVTERSGGRGRGRGERGGGFPRSGGPPSAATSGGEPAEPETGAPVQGDGATADRAAASDAEVTAVGAESSDSATSDGAEPAAVGAPPEADA